jgi:hypothetical protein
MVNLIHKVAVLKVIVVKFTSNFHRTVPVMSGNSFKGDGFVSTKIAFQKLRAKNITLSTVVGVVKVDVDFLWKIQEGSLSFRIFLELLTPF